MTHAPHEVILASAGTGKTFRLARRYVRLLATGEDHGSILATTFTRKAAREILARVLQWLARGAAGGEDFQALTKDVWGEDAPAPGWSEERCQELLREVVHGLHRFQVRTLDAWFASLARLFGLELGLPPGWTIADDRDDARLRDAVLTRVFEEEGEAVRGMLAGLQGGDFTRRVHSAQQELLTAGLELLRDSDAQAWDALASGNAVVPDPAQLSARVEQTEMPLTQADKPRAHWVNAFAKLQLALDTEDAWAVLGIGPIRKLLEGEAKFDRVEIEGDMDALLRDCLAWAGHEILRELHAGNQAVRKLLELFEARYAEAKRSAGGYRHDDVPRTLVAAAAQLDPVSVAYRSGARIRHLMLDEFQDTSVWQWRVLEPLLERIAHGKGGDGGQPSLFCVGDVKQAIYTWRQGEPELLAGLSKWYKLGEPEQLAKSWRSSPAVLELVNVVFGSLGERAGEVPGMDEEAARRWAEHWMSHEAAKSGMAGAAGAQLVLKNQEGDAPMLETCAEVVARIHRKHPKGTIGVLLRRRKQMAALLHLLEERGIQASGEGGSELTDAQAVQAVLSAFRLADRPTDTLAAYHLASGPLSAAVGLDAARDIGEDRKAFEEAAAAASAALRADLLARGVGGFVESYRAAVAAGWPGDRWERRRYAQLVDLAHGFDAGPALRPIDFVEHVEGTPLENPAPSRVRVMTIHGSKGLEFDSVVFPLWHSEAGGRDLFLARRADPRAPYCTASKRPSQQVAALSPELERLFAETATRDQTEALCVLYVALTRARQRLEVLVEEGPDKPGSFSLARLMETMLGLGEGASWSRTTAGDEDAPRPADAAPDAADGADDAADEAQDAAGAPALALRPASGTRGRPRWAPSGAEAESTVDGGKLFLRGGEAARTRGTAIHRLFQEVAWLDQPTAFDATDVELCSLLVQEGVGDGSTHVDALRSFRKALARTEVKQLLMRAAYQEQGGHEPWVWSERKFAVRVPEPGGAEDAILHGEFDRVVVERDGDGKPLRAHVVDFKTGQVRDDAELARKREAYRPQMLAYRKAVCALTGLAPEAVRLSLLFVDAGRVVHLD